MKWINTVETIAEVEQAGTKGQWRIGDAIIRDLKDEGLLQNQVDSDGIPEIKGGVWEECTTKLAEKGIENAGTGKPFAYQYIGILFRTAYAFPRDERNAKFSWSVHRFAGTPQNLKNAITALRKVDKKVSTPNVAALIEHWADEADAKRQRELEKAKAKKTAAKKKKVTATEDKLATKDGAEREAAEARRQEAQREIEEATAVIKQAGGPPQDVDADVMQERCQFLLLVPGYSSSYAGLRLCHGFPTLRPDRALQFRIPLGPIVSLHQLRSGSLRFVRWLRRYYR